MTKSAIECVESSLFYLNRYYKNCVNDFVDLKAQMIEPDDVELNRLMKSKIVREKCFSFGIKIYWIKYDEERYLLITSGNILDKGAIDTGLSNLSTQETDILPSLFFRVMGDSSFPILPKGDPDKCYKDLKALIESSKDRKINSIEFIQDYFEDFWVYSIFDDSIVANDIKEDSLYCLLLAFSCKNLHLKHNPKFIDASINYLIDEKDTFLPLDSLEISITSQHWKHSFLEAYRAIESLYSIPWAFELKKALNLDDNTSAVDVAKFCHKKLGWHRKEELSLNKLIAILNEDDFSIFSTNFFNSKIENLDDNQQTDKIIKISKLIYKIRNQSVHHFGFETEKIMKITEQDYSELVYILWILAFRLYKFLHKELCSKELGLINAITEGRNNDFVSEDEIFSILKNSHE